MTDNPNDKRFSGRISDYLPLIQATDGLTLSQVCSLSGLESSTIQNWIKRGYVPHPVGKKYHERHLARILLISRLRESMQIDRVGELLRYINGDADDEGDDLISEQALYDLFCEIAEELQNGERAPDRVEETVYACVMRSVGSDSSPKLIAALKIMALTCMANLYKREADALFQKSVQES